MQMAQIRYFLSICEQGSFTAASHASNISQPSLTVAIQKLEAELGGELFLRDRSGAQLTPLGKIVEPRLRHILKESEDTITEAMRYIRLDRTPIKIGIGENIGPSIVTPTILYYQSAHPKIEFELLRKPRTQLLSDLNDGTLDVAIISETNLSDDLYRKDTILTETYHAVFSQQHPLASQQHITLQDLTSLNLLDRPNCEMRERLTHACLENGCELYARYRSNDEHWLLELAAMEAGAVILPKSMIPQTQQNLVSLPLSGIDLHRRIYAARARKQPNRAEIQTFIQQVIKQTERKISLKTK